MADLVKLFSSSANNRIGLRVMYALYKYDNFSQLLNGHYRFKENPQSVTIECCDYNDLALRRVFFYANSNESRKYKDTPFSINGKECYCSQVWYDETEHLSIDNDSKSFPDINNLRRILMRCYKGIFKLERESEEWVFYGPSELKKYISDVDSGKKGSERAETYETIESLKLNIEILNDSLVSMQEKIRVVQNNINRIAHLIS